MVTAVCLVMFFVAIYAKCVTNGEETVPAVTKIIVHRKLFVLKSPLRKYWIELFQATLRSCQGFLYYMICAMQRFCPLIQYMQRYFHQILGGDKYALAFVRPGSVWGFKRMSIWLTLWDQDRPREQCSWGQHGVHLGPTGPRWAPCWPHKLSYLENCRNFAFVILTTFFKWKCHNLIQISLKFVPNVHIVI